jgi:molybdopterin/thiamine biosynthesis adenylyltransferase
MSELGRYVRQTRFSLFGEEGQRRLRNSSALLCGCGALGNMMATILVRGGIGRLRIVDPDRVELVNLQRQILFDEADATQNRLKVEAAAEKLRQANSQVIIETIPLRATPENIEELSDQVNIILDGTDNFETRFVLNEFAVKKGIPWVFGGVLGAEGQVMPIIPGRTPCLNCLLHDCPPAGLDMTCEMVGIFASVVGVIASLQAMEAIKILSGHLETITPRLTVVDLWNREIRQIDVSNLRDRVDCPVCKRQHFRFLESRTYPAK